MCGLPRPHQDGDDSDNQPGVHGVWPEHRVEPAACSEPLSAALRQAEFARARHGAPEMDLTLSELRQGFTIAFDK